MVGFSQLFSGADNFEFLILIDVTNEFVQRVYPQSQKVVLNKFCQPSVVPFRCDAPLMFLLLMVFQEVVVYKLTSNPGNK